MAQSTYLELCNKLVQDAGITGGDLSSVTSQSGIRKKVVTWIRDADLQIQKLHRDWNFLYTEYTVATIASTKDYVKPSGMGMWDTASFCLNYTSSSPTDLGTMDYREWRDNYGKGTQTETTPSDVIIKPNKDLILYPTPDTVYTLTADYYALPTALAANTDNSAIPEQYEDVIIYKAKMMFAMHEEAQDLFKSAQYEYEKALDNLIANEAPHMNAMNMAGVDMTVRVA